MAATRRRPALIAAVVLVLALLGGTIAFIAWQSSREPAVDPSEVLANIPDAEVMWFSQPQESRDEVCAGLLADPDGYYEFMKQTWLEEADLEPALFGALMTTIINDCGL